MKTKQVTRYICDFCGKTGYSLGCMRNHESHCTMNPARRCRMCENVDQEPPTPERLAQLVARRVAAGKGDGEPMRTVTIDLTDAADVGIQEIIATTSLKSTRDVFQNALNLLRIYVDAQKEGKQMRLVSRDDPIKVSIVDMQIDVR